jgi:hypothetical protein
MTPVHFPLEFLAELLKRELSCWWDNWMRSILVVRRFKGTWNEADFLVFLQKLVPHESLTLPFEPFRIWLRIHGDIRNRNTTPRLGELTTLRLGESVSRRLSDSANRAVAVIQLGLFNVQKKTRRVGESATPQLGDQESLTPRLGESVSRYGESGSRYSIFFKFIIKL